MGGVRWRSRRRASGGAPGGRRRRRPSEAGRGGAAPGGRRRRGARGIGGGAAGAVGDAGERGHLRELVGRHLVGQRLDDHLGGVLGCGPSSAPAVLKRFFHSGGRLSTWKPLSSSQPMCVMCWKLVGRRDLVLSRRASAAKLLARALLSPSRRSPQPPRRRPRLRAPPRAATRCASAAACAAACASFEPAALNLPSWLRDTARERPRLLLL